MTEETTHKHHAPVWSAFYEPDNRTTPHAQAYTANTSSEIPGTTQHIDDDGIPSEPAMPEFREKAIGRAAMRLTVGRGSGTMVAAWLGRAVPNAFKFVDADNKDFNYEYNSWYHKAIRVLAGAYDATFDGVLGKNRSRYEITEEGREHYNLKDEIHHEVTVDDIVNGYFRPRRYALFADGSNSAEHNHQSWQNKIVEKSLEKQKEELLAKAKEALEELKNFNGSNDEYSAVLIQHLQPYTNNPNFELDLLSKTNGWTEHSPTQSKIKSLVQATLLDKKQWEALSIDERRVAVKYWMETEFRPQGNMKTAGQYWMEISTDFAFMGAVDYTVREAFVRFGNIIQHGFKSLLNPGWRESEEAKNFKLTGELKSFAYNSAENFIRGDGIYDYFVGILYAPVKEFFSRTRLSTTPTEKDAAESLKQRSIDLSHLAPQQRDDVIKAEKDRMAQDPERSPLKSSHKLYDVPFDVYNWLGKFVWQDMLIDWWLRPKQSRLREYLHEHNPGDGVNILGRVWNTALDVVGFSTMRSVQIFSHMHPAVSAFFTPGRHYGTLAESAIRKARYSAMFETMAKAVEEYALKLELKGVNADVVANTLKNLWEPNKDYNYHRSAASEKQYQYRSTPISDFVKDASDILKTHNNQKLGPEGQATYATAIEDVMLRAADKWQRDYVKGINRPEVHFTPNSKDNAFQSNLGEKFFQPFTDHYAHLLQQMFYGRVAKHQSGGEAGQNDDLDIVRNRADKYTSMIELSEGAAGRYMGYAPYFAAKDILDTESLNNSTWNAPLRVFNRACFRLKVKPKDWKEQRQARTEPEMQRTETSSRGGNMNIGFDGAVIGNAYIENKQMQDLYNNVMASVDEKLAASNMLNHAAHQQAEQTVKAIMSHMQTPEQARTYANQIVDQALAATLSNEQRTRVMEAPLKPQ